MFVLIRGEHVPRMGDGLQMYSCRIILLFKRIIKKWNLRSPIDSGFHRCGRDVIYVLYDVEANRCKSSG